MNWNFLTFGAGSLEMERAARRLSKQASDTGFFTKNYVVTEKTLKYEHFDFFRENEAFIKNNPIGYGLWKWKPYIVQSYLSKIESGDGLLYLDAGCQFNFSSPKAIHRFYELFWLAEQKSGLFYQLKSDISNEFFFAEYKWTKPEVFKRIPIAESQRVTGQIQGGILFLVKNEKTMKLVSDWKYFCNFQESILLSNPMSLSALPEKFQAHRNDQSILSVLLKKLDFYAIPEETYWSPNWQVDGKDYPIWALRNKTGITKFQFKFAELLDYLIRVFNIIKNKIVNKFQICNIFKTE